MFKKIQYLYIILSLLFSPFALSQQGNSVVHDSFVTNLYDHGELYFEETQDFEYPINFMLKYECNGKVKQYIIDKYSHEGGVPEISSVFFHKQNNRPYIFTIVMWQINHRGIGTYGQYYQVYGYTKNNENVLVKDKILENDRNLSGIEGFDDGQESHFKYKTAAEVKKYIDETYNKK